MVVSQHQIVVGDAEERTSYASTVITHPNLIDLVIEYDGGIDVDDPRMLVALQNGVEFGRSFRHADPASIHKHLGLVEHVDWLEPVDGEMKSIRVRMYSCSGAEKVLTVTCAR